MEKFFSFLRAFFRMRGELPLLFRLWGPGRTSTCTHLLYDAMVHTMLPETEDLPRSYRSGRGKLAFTLETSGNCLFLKLQIWGQPLNCSFCITLPWLQALVIQSDLPSNASLALSVLFANMRMYMHVHTWHLYVPGSTGVHGCTHRKFPGCLALWEIFAFLDTGLKFVR